MEYDVNEEYTCYNIPTESLQKSIPHMTETNLSAFIWSVADLLRGDFKQSEYGKVILPFTVLRRLDCVLAGTKAAVLSEQQKLSDWVLFILKGSLLKSVMKKCKKQPWDVMTKSLVLILQKI